MMQKILTNYEHKRKMTGMLINRLKNTNVGTAESTIDANEVKFFAQFGIKWWDELGPMKGLHNMNNLRVPLVRDGLINCGMVKAQHRDSPKPLTGLHILDVGCGGGILSEPLARLGANVTGIDATKNMITIAEAHAKFDPRLLNLRYLNTSIEEHAKENVEKYDAIVASEVVEHVNEKEQFISYCTNCLKRGGSFFLTTPNQTLLSKVLTIYAAENIFGSLPVGTHDWDKFISPHVLQRYLEMHDCRTRLVHGMLFNVISNTWYWTSSSVLHYAIHAIKNSDE